MTVLARGSERGNTRSRACRRGRWCVRRAAGGCRISVRCPFRTRRRRQGRSARPQHRAAPWAVRGGGRKRRRGRDQSHPKRRRKVKNTNIVHGVGAELELSCNMCSVSRSYKTCASTRTLAFKRRKGEVAEHGLLEGGDGPSLGAVKSKSQWP